MGMFSSLFGSSGSDKADKMRQAALDAFGAVKTPELSALQVQLQKSVLAGKITPEEAEATLLNSNAFNDIKTDPALKGAQKQALQALQDTASEGGLTAIDRAQLQDITDQQEQENKSSGDAIMANARARGTGNSNLTSVNKLIAEQGSADRASKAGLGVASLAQARALEALKAAGTQAGAMENTEFNQGAQKASAQNAIDQFNAANKTDTNKFNVTNDLNSQGANVSNAQHVADENAATSNTQALTNANASQTVFNDQLGKASGIAGVDTGWANDASAQKKAETGADMALTGGLISGAAQAGAASLGIPPGATKPGPNAPAYSDGGEVKGNNSLEEEYDKFVKNFCYGGTVKMSDGGSISVKPGNNFTDGGDVPGTPVVPGNSPVNDVVDAKVSPREYVVSVEDRDAIEKKTGTPIEVALRRLKNPAPTIVSAPRG